MEHIKLNLFVPIYLCLLSGMLLVELFILRYFVVCHSKYFTSTLFQSFPLNILWFDWLSYYMMYLSCYQDVQRMFVKLWYILEGSSRGLREGTKAYGSAFSKVSLFASAKPILFQCQQFHFTWA